MASFVFLRARSDFRSAYFDRFVNECNSFGDLENTTHWERFSEMATYNLYSQLPKMISDVENAAKKAEKERNKLMRLIHNSYVPIELPPRPFIDAYRLWQTLANSGACCRAVVVMLREGFKALSFSTVEKSFMDRFYDVGGFFDQVFQLNDDVRGGVFDELRRIKLEMFARRNDLDAFFAYVLNVITNFFNTIKKYMSCGLESRFFSSYFSHDGVFKRKELKFKEYLLFSLDSLMTLLLTDMEELEDIWALVIIKAFYEDLMPLDRRQMKTHINKELHMEIKELQFVFRTYGYCQESVDALDQFVYEKFGWHARYQQPFIEVGQF